MYPKVTVGDVTEHLIRTRHVVNIFIRQTAATGAGASVWGMWSGLDTSMKLIIHSIQFTLSFDGTGAASLMRYQWVRGDTITVFSGGANIPSAPLKFNDLATNASIQALDTGLTTTGITGTRILGTFTAPRVTISATQPDAVSNPYVLDFSSLGHIGGLELSGNQALLLRNGPTNASVIGDTVMGTVIFSEVTL